MIIFESKNSRDCAKPFLLYYILITFFFIDYLATSWNWARVMLGPLNLFTISLICSWEEWSKLSKKQRKENDSPQYWEGFVRGIWQRLPPVPLASARTCPHGPGRFAKAPTVNKPNQTQECHLNVCHASGECHLISWSEPSQGEQSRKIGGSFESSW